MELLKTEEYHEDFGCCLFFSFSRDEQGHVLGEPPEVCFSSGYMEDGFDEKEWTHFIKGVDMNFVFTGVDPVRFPRIN